MNGSSAPPYDGLTQATKLLLSRVKVASRAMKLGRRCGYSGKRLCDRRMVLPRPRLLVDRALLEAVDATEATLVIGCSQGSAPGDNAHAALRNVRLMR